MNLEALTLLPRTGTEQFHHAGTALGFDLLSFWRWACSDLCSNLMRGVLAEYMIAKAVNGCAGIRCEWDAWDVVTPEGIKVEVKTSAYLQTWKQRKLSAIGFDIGPKQGGDAAQNTVAGPPTRLADVYVFALLAHTEKATLDPLDVNQWEFFVLRTAVLNERCPKQKTLSLGSLLKLGPTKVSYAGLAQAILACAQSICSPLPDPASSDFSPNAR